MQPAAEWLSLVATLAFLGGVLLKLNQLTGFPFFQMFGLWALIGAMLLVSRWVERNQAVRVEESVLERLRQLLPAGSRLLRLRRDRRLPGQADLVILAPAGVGLLLYDRSSQQRLRRGAVRALGESARRAEEARRRAERLLAEEGGAHGLVLRAGVLMLRRRVRETELEEARTLAEAAGRVDFLNAEELEEWLHPLTGGGTWEAGARAAFARRWRDEASLEPGSREPAAETARAAGRWGAPGAQG
ncbi:MAG: hypothetical protein QJR14_10060 [Bacillota bacterium]|nr:hypothetical protein [Bacillota bacterium]